jgi:hypothetical protein
MPTDLPPIPDFADIEAKAPHTSDQRTQVLALIGNLVYTWSNNESVFIYLLMVLLESDFDAAAITFVSLNTTRARLDLIRRLTKAKVKDPETVRKVERLIERFNECTRVRNEFNHCIYQMDGRGRITHTSTLRISETADEVGFATARPLDAARMRQIAATIRRLTKLNRDLWTFLPVLEDRVRQSEARRSGNGSPSGSSEERRTPEGRGATP